jgi:hypothetical protein
MTSIELSHNFWTVIVLNETFCTSLKIKGGSRYNVTLDKKKLLFLNASILQVQAVVSELMHKLTPHTARTQARPTPIPKDTHATERYLKINELQA